MARHRKKANKTLPPNLYEGVNGHYKYRRPDTGKWHSLGKDRPKAVSAAQQLNSMLMVGRDLVEKVVNNSTLFNTFLDQFESKIIPERDLADETIKAYKNKIITIRKYLGQKPADEISVMEIAEFLNQFPSVNSNRYRSLLGLIFKYAIAHGICQNNPAEKTIPRKIKKKRRRLTLEAYQAIHELSPNWLKNAMDIGLQTLQRREDIVAIKFSNIEKGFLYIIQNKTKKHGESAYLKIKINSPLKEILNRCRDGMLSPYLIHRKPDRFSEQTRNAKSKKHYTQITPDYLTKSFTEIRDSLSMFKNTPLEERPTFHEIRSLGIKLYEEQGEDAQFLAGHKTRAMTDKYKQGHEIRWTEVAAGLNLIAKT
jgi:hypothetical protein